MASDLTSYLDELATAIRGHAPSGGSSTRDLDSLFRLYAVLALAKGVEVTAEDVHNAWVAWTQDSDADHSALRPFSQLDHETQLEDCPYAEAIHSAVRELRALQPQR